MKKIYLWSILTLLLMFLLPNWVGAQGHDAYVTSAQALDVGYTFMRTGDGSKGNGTKSGNVSKQAMRLVYTGQAVDSTTSDTTDCYYVFALQPKGFVIVAADDRVEPILGYSYDNDFVVEGMPEQVRGWLGSYERQIQLVAKSDREADPVAKDRWTALKLGQPMNSAKNGTTVGPLLTTAWNQGQYYNNLCPADASGPAGHVYTGCVATAMAQIINYWEYPTQGRGIHSYNSSYGTLEVNYNSASYDYTLMPDALTNISFATEVNAVATLMRDCGVAVNMGYSSWESGSFDVDARAAFVNFFRYSPNLSFAEKAYFSESEWDAMLHADLDNGRPVFYSGQGSGGHAFVCDGYNADGYYHFNFGWGGFADGWFLTNSITPGSSNFNDSQAALFGIVPDNTGNVILSQTQGTSTFIVDEPLEFYHLMGYNAYEGSYYGNSCNNTVNFISTNNTNQIVADVLEYEDQTLTFYDGDGNHLRSLSGGSDNDLSPVVSNHNVLNIVYSGNMYYAGFKLSISQTDNNGCRMVSNITSFTESTTVHLTWTENGTATQWEIEYGVKGFVLGSGTLYTATSNTATFSNLAKFTEYDFYIRPVCGVGQYGLRNKISVMVEAEYWQDIVTSQPAGYVYNAQTNSVEISTAEGLAWWAKNVSFSYSNPKVYLTADINLSGHKWRPAEMFYQVFDGQGHQITNAYIRENGNYIGFFSMIDNGSVENLGLTDSYIKGNGSCGGICGYNFGGMMRNSYVSNSTVDGSDAFMVGGLIGQHQGGVINCFVNAYVIGNHWNGLMIGSSLNNASVKNCYAAGTMKYLSWCNMGGIAAVSSEVSNCYSVWTSGGVVGNTIGPIADTSTFVKTNDGCILLTPIDFDGVIETDLLSALNRGLVLYNDSSCLTWAADTGNVNGGFPVFGSNHYIVQCKDVSDVSVEQVFVNNNYGVKVSWTENGDATQWRIRYRQHDRPDTAYTIITTSNNPDTIYGMPLRNTYDFNVHAVCNNNSRSAWSETQSLVVDLPFWTDIVTTQPTGYVEDADGNVEIYSAEGLAWLSVITHGLHNQPQSSFEEKTVTLKSDIDLDGYRWYPIGNERWWDGLAGVFRGGFSGTFDGQNHSISNIYINGASGLFGLLHLGGVKNVVLDGGTIIGGNGGLIGTAMDCYEIFNCHSSATVYGGGALCGGISNNGNGPSKITVSNCSSSGMVYGQDGCGSLIGTVAAYNGDIVVRNCYATGNVEGSQYFIGGLIGYIRGAKIYNCFSTGHVEFNPDYRIGNVIGCQDLGAEGEYIYGQDNVNAGVALIGCGGNYPNTSLFHHEGNTNTLLSSVSINGETPNNLLDALNTWVISQNDPTLRTWVLDTLTGYPIFGDYFVPSCYNPSDLIVTQATVVGDPTIKTRLSWTQVGEPDHWEVLYVATGQSVDLGTIIPVHNNPCILVGIPVGQALDFYVRAVCGEGNVSDWCGPVTYLPDKLHWTDVVTTKPEGYYEDADGNVYISSAEGLSWLASIANELNGAQHKRFDYKQIVLTKDIDLSAYRWTAIGDGWFHMLYGSFNGNNHVISGLYCNEYAGYQGLFGYMSGDISNLIIKQCYVHGKRTSTGNGTSGSIGGIVGYSSVNSIVNCMVTGNVNGGGVAGSHIGASWATCRIVNSGFIGNDIFDGHSVGICESSLSAGTVNCYVVNPPSRYYVGETGNSDFSGNGYTWTLSIPPYMNGAFRSDLVEALNIWVDVNNTEGQYHRWAADTAMVNGGYPIFEFVSYPAVAAQDTVVANGYYSWHGMVFITDTVLTETFTASDGADSVVTHYVFINPTPLTTISVDTCGSYTWNGETYYESGDYAQVVSSTNDGDSVVVLHLTINRLTGVDEQLVCGNSYTWIDGVTYVADNNTATYTLQTADGCDSVVTLHLTVNNSSASDTTVVVCNSFDWYEYTNLTQSGDYTRTLTNAVGCDSVVTLHLTINQPTSGVDVQTACGSYIWNGQTYTTSGVYHQTLTAANGCDSVVTLHLTINSYPSVSISGGSTVCTGGTTTLFANVIPNATYVWYKDGVEIAFNTPTISVTDGGAYTVEAAVNGCSSLSNPIFVTLGQTPEFQLYATETSICVGSTTTITAYAAGANNGNILFSWSDYMASGSSYVFSPYHAGTYNFDVTATDILSGCMSQSSISINVNGLSEKPLVKADKVKICEGGQVTLTVNNPEYNAIYSWYRDGVEIYWATQTSFVDYPATAGYHTYTVMASQNGCNSISEPVTITVSPQPNVSIIRVPGYDATVCEGGSTAIQAVVEGGYGSAIYRWYKNGTLLPNETNYILYVSNLSVGMNDVYTVIVDQYDAGCTGSASSAISSLVTVGQAPELQLYATETSICVGNSTTITAHTAGLNNGNILFSWSEYTATGSSYIFSPYHAGTYNFDVTATDIIFGCVSHASISINVNGLPEKPFVMADNINICEGGQVTLTVTNPVYNATYAWYRDGVEIYGATQTTLIDYPTTAGYHTYTVMASQNGCNSISEPVTITVSPQPNVTITRVPGYDAMVCEGGSTAIQAVVEGGYGSATYRWYKNGVLLPNETNYILYVSNLMVGMYDVYTVVVDQYGEGCTSSASSDISSLVTVVAPSYKDLFATACDSYTWNNVTYTESGEYTQTFTNAAGCDSVVTLHLTVNNTPSTPLLMVDNTVICDGGEVTLSITNPDSNPLILYTWYRNGVVIPGATHTIFTDMPTTVDGEATNYTYNVMASYFNSGCYSNSSALTVSVNDVPETPVLVVDNAIVFEGGQVTLTVSNPVSGAIYIWYRNGIIIEGATQATFVDTPIAIDGETTYYTYSVIVELPISGCISYISASTVVTVPPMPVAAVTVEGGTMLCEGGSTTLHVDVDPYYDPTYVYQWYKDGVLIPGATSTDYVVVELARTTPYNFMVMVSGFNGGFSITADAPAITVVPQPSVTVSISEDTICAGGTATLTATVEGGVADIDGYDFLWLGMEETSTPLPEFVGTDSSYTISGYKPAGSYSYRVMVSSEYGCNVQSGAVILSVVSQPVVTIQAEGYGVMVCDGGSTVIQASVSGGYGDISYQWFKNGYLLAEEINQTLVVNNLTYGENDTYTIVVSQVGSGCLNSASAGINTLVSVFPNYTVDVSGPNDICEGGTLTMFAEVNNMLSGDMLSYQWHEIINGQDLLIDGANSVTYTTADLQSGNLYEYYVAVSSGIPSCSAASASKGVIVNTLSYTTLYETSCENYTWNDTIYSESGEYTQTFTNAAGCDSVVTLHLTINPATEGDTAAIVCGSFDWYGAHLTQSGDYYHTLTNAAGCDSVVTLHLTVSISETTDFSVTACEPFVWEGTTCMVSGEYTQTFTNAAGCDSVVTLHLTINNPTAGDTTATVCGSFSWYEYSELTQSGDYTHTLTNAAGCDSVVTLHLTVTTPTAGDTTATVCDSFSWYEHFDLTQSGDYTHTLTNAAGCDSVVTLHLTVNTPTAGDTTATVCGNFSWYEHFDLTQSGDYTHTLTNAAGCDSVVTLHLTINQPVTSTCTATICDSELPYVWNGLTFNEAGTQNMILQTVNGCDSTVEMTLTVNPSVTIEAYLTISENDLPFTYGDTTFMPGTVQSGDYTFNFTTADGCDSIIILHLTVETGISGYDLGAFMKVYPNPIKDRVNVQLTGYNGQSDNMEIQMFDMYGKLLQTVSVTKENMQIDLSSYAQGVYFIKASVDGKAIGVRKIVKD